MSRTILSSRWIGCLSVGIFAGSLAVAGGALTQARGSAKTAKPPTVNFDRDIRPIFAENCYPCHGPDEERRKAGLRLDTKEGPYRKLKSGDIAVVPGDLSKSAIWYRITTKDPDDRMPKKGSNRHLTGEQVRLIRDWIVQGAKWRSHWAYVKPKAPVLPEVKEKSWPRNPIDYFVLHRMEEEGMHPSPEASKETLIRRVSLDLTGLPPTLEQVDAFLADNTPDAYEKVVDRLLASPHYGERMAMFWLDLARYADTNGYHIDNHRNIWKWREWVIRAFNQNMPYDQFAIKQIAGDLLPHHTTSDLVATGFNRNEMVNFEGGADPKEYLVYYNVGRVDTTSEVFLGTTLRCARCHDHKFDPISQKNFYQFFAFFNSVAEEGLDGAHRNPVPTILVPSAAQKKELADFKRQIAALKLGQKTLLESSRPDWDRSESAWLAGLRTNVLGTWKTIKPSGSKSKAGASLTVRPDDSILVSGTNAAKETYELTFRTEKQGITGLRLEVLPDQTLPHRGAGRGANGDFILTGLEVHAKALQKKPAASEPMVLGAWYAVGPFPASSSEEAFNKEFGPESGTVDLSKGFESGEYRWTKHPEWKDGEIHKLKGGIAATYLYRTITVKSARQILLSLGSNDGIQVWVNGKRWLSKNASRTVAADQDKLRVPLVSGTNQLLMKINNQGGDYGFYFAVASPDLREYPVDIAAAAADYSAKDFSIKGAIDGKIDTGWSVGGKDGEGTKVHEAFFVTRQPFGFEGGTKLTVRLKFSSDQGGRNLGRFRLAISTSQGLNDFVQLPDAIRADLLVGPERWTEDQKEAVRKYYRENYIQDLKDFDHAVSEKERALAAFKGTIPETMVMEDLKKPRVTHVLFRGDFQQPREKVSPGVPEQLFPWSPDLPRNRLGLAKWLVDPNNPLVSRVTVNHFWAQYFGKGIVETPGDFGSQGAWPTFPKLLDWLAVRFIQSGWNVKALQRLIVTSATYRQSALEPTDLLAKDPRDRYLDRFPRLRLAAEAIRDNALEIAGLINLKMGGRSVLPYQPPGLWKAVSFGAGFSSQEYVQSKGTDNFRRGLYTYWKRAVPYASFVAFDAPDRTECTVERPRTDTPLQALVLMNDPVYIEAARGFATRIMKEGGPTVRSRLVYAFQVCLARRPTPKEVAVLRGIYQKQLAHYVKDRVAAVKLVTIGVSRPPDDVDYSELAAWTSIGNILLNLDETINKG